jgi:hypothetical protein
MNRAHKLAHTHNNRILLKQMLQSYQTLTHLAKFDSHKTAIVTRKELTILGI